MPSLRMYFYTLKNNPRHRLVVYQPFQKDKVRGS
jgi:hypothetical protein